MKHLAALILLTIVAAPACDLDERPDEHDPAAAALAPVTNPLFDGYVVPMNATELRAPQNTFRVGGWNSNSSWIKLIHLAEDGTEVKEGDVVGKFEFPADKAKVYVDEQIRNAEAQRDRSGHEKEQQVDELSSSEKKKVIDAKRAELETLRKGVIAERDWQLAVIAHQQAEFDAEATTKHRKAVERELRAEADYHERNVAKAHTMQKRYDTFASRFVVRAPHDGVLRHAFYRRRGRKVQKGDGMPAGNHFASVARDKSVSVQFFIPERYWQQTRDAENFIVESATSKQSWPVTVERIEEFPQELGFLKNDDNLPNAREKAYVVWARFEEQPEGLSAGIEVRVRRR